MGYYISFTGNLIRRVLSGNSGTPKRPKGDIDVYLFALFNENQKPGPTSERNYGMFYPSQQKVYDVSFVLGSGNSNGKGAVGWSDDGGKGSTNNNSTGAGNNQSSSGSGTVRSSSTGQTWCVANAMVGKEKLQKALDFACGEGGADCKSIQPGSACYEPNTVEAHASFAFNNYYQKNGRGFWTCHFEGAAYVVSQAPSELLSC